MCDLRHRGLRRSSCRWLVVQCVGWIGMLGKQGFWSMLNHLYGGCAGGMWYNIWG